MARSENNKAIAIAASNAADVAKRFSAVTSEAKRIDDEMQGRAIMRALNGPDGLHVHMTDRHGTAIEIFEGKVAVSVRKQEPSE